MTTATRLSLFFLAALGLVLIGFSCAIYALAAWRLVARLDEELEAALSVLVASIEVHPDSVEWEPLQRRITLGSGIDLAQVRWTLRDERGVLVDRAENLDDQAATWSPDASDAWRVVTRQLQRGDFQERAISRDAVPIDGTGTQPPTNRTAVRQRFYITVALSQKPLRETLAHLAVALAAVSVVIWLLFAAVARRLCRRALRPLLQMAAEARGIQQNPDGQAILRVPPSRDELSELALAFNSLLAALRVRVEQQRRFAGDASHQLRTPLTALLTAVDVAGRQPRSIEEYQRVLEVAGRRGRDLQQIIDTLLALTHGDALASLPPAEQIELNEWLRRRLTRWQDSARTTEIELVEAGRDVVVTTQPALLGQVFDNLVDNAMKYSAAGTPIQIAIESSRMHGDGPPHLPSATITVSDHGGGIDEGELAQVFEPFFRSQSARLAGVSGVGLGLTIAQRLVSMLGGRIDVENNAGGGARFRITIPRDASALD
jgi:signal transduction histidine kinase